jgi:hypothetical protein
MGDCRLCSLVFCHDHLRADPGISRLACFPARFEAPPKLGGEKPELNKLSRQMFMRSFRRHDSAAATETANKAFPKDSHKPMRD